MTDHIQLKEVIIECCLTDKMLADMFTKPLQGPTFHHFCTTILNLPNNDEVCPTMVVPMAGYRSVLRNESATHNNRQTSKSIKSERSQQMAKQIAKYNVGRKNELNAHSFLKTLVYLCV